MKPAPLIFLVVVLLLLLPGNAFAQHVQVGEILVVASPEAGAADESFRSAIVDDRAPAWRTLASGVSLHLLHADRGDRSGESLLVWTLARRSDGASVLHDGGDAPFTETALRDTGGGSFASTYRVGDGGFTEYELIGAENLGALPTVDILGMHVIKVRPDRAAAFEGFVRENLHPALADYIPGMSLLYYKAVRGEHAGSYLTLFAIDTVARRETFWPTGGPEQAIVGESFAPLRELAQKLKTYLVEDSYLNEDTGAGAAIFESLEWTDFVDVHATR